MRPAPTVLAFVLATTALAAPTGAQPRGDTLFLEVGSPLVDGRVYKPHAARVRVRQGDSDRITAEWTNELTLGDSAGRPVMRWVTRGRQFPASGDAPTWELRQTYDAVTMAPYGFHSRYSNGAGMEVAIRGNRVQGVRRAAGDPTAIPVDVTVDRIGFFAGASDLVPAAVGLRAGRVIVAPVWRPQWTAARRVIFTVIGEERVDVEGTPTRAWKVEERNYDDRALTATWWLLDADPYMVYGETPLPDGRVQRMSEVSITAGDTTHYTVDNHGRKAGDLLVVTRGDSLVARFVYTDRNRGQRVETRYRLGAAGRPLGGEQRPVLADGTVGEPSERFDVVGDSVRSAFGNGSGSTSALAPNTFVAVRGGTPLEQAWLARHLLAQPDGSSGLLGGGTARAEVIADTVLPLGAARQRARLVMVHRNQQPTPSGVWLDERGDLLATDVAWFITVRRGAEPLLPALRAIELRWREARAEAIAQEVVTPTSGTIAIRNGDLFDAESGTVRPRQTVLVRGDRIVAVGAAAEVRIPAGATVIDATGKTVMPGMWDMHTHLQVANQSHFSLLQLAYGLTTVRDLAADVDVAVSQRDRERAGKLASPRVILGGFIEGPLAWAGPSAAVVSTEAEARAWVARYDSLGYKQIKLYNIVHPDLVPVIAAEAKRRGMLLSGHIPRGMSIAAALALGYDEIQHAAFFFSDFFPDSLYLPRMRAYSQVATAVAPSFDVYSPGMTRLLDAVKASGAAVDGTFNLWIGGGGAQVGAGGSPDQQKADSAYLNLIRRLHAHGIPLIAGTDNVTGMTFRRELEMYERAGIPAARVLQIATIDAARFMRDTTDHGSIRVGKVADLLIVAGKPAERIADLARIETVIRAGRRYEVSDLLAATGLRQRAPAQPRRSR